MNVKNLEILANEIQEQISKLKKDEGDIGKLLSLSSSFQEALIIFKYQLSQNISLNENELVEEMEKNQTNLIDAIEKEEFDEIQELHTFVRFFFQLNFFSFCFNNYIKFFLFYSIY